MDERKVCTLEDLQRAFGGEIVDLPGTTEEYPVLTVRLRRPSLLKMVQGGKIPNELLLEANKLFTRGAQGVANSGIADANMMTDMCKILDVICEAAFVQPKYSEIKAAGIELTDEQLLAVFNYTQNGVDALKSFHTDGGSATADRNFGNA